MAIAPPVRWAFFPLDDQLGLRPNLRWTPKVEEGMVRLGTWMPFRAARRELAFFLGVEVAEASVRRCTEEAGATQVFVQTEAVETIQRERPESPPGPEVQLLSVDGALIQMVTGEWKEVKTLAVGEVEKVTQKDGEEVVQTRALSYLSRMSEAGLFQQETLAEVYRRGVEKAGTVCLVSDGAEWIQHWGDYHRPDAVRILDFAHAMEYVSTGGQAALQQLPKQQGAQEKAPDGVQADKRTQKDFESWLTEQRRELLSGEADIVLGELERLRTAQQAAGEAAAVETLDKSLHYLRERRPMLNYARFREQGYPIGSGSVESANKLVVQSRMKQAGMRWEPCHVNAILALRNLACNDRWAEGWTAIRQQWREQDRAQRRQRAVRPTPCTQAVSAATPPPPAKPVNASLSSSEVPLSPSVEASASRPRRPAPTHPWRRPLLPRRSA